MDRAVFLRLVANRLYPILRSENFRGSGTTLRRHMAPIVHVFNVQGSRWGNACFLNLGAHLDFMPTAGGGECDPARLKEYECWFRDRVDPPPDRKGEWPYGPDMPSAEQTVDLMLEAWRSQGQAFFRRYSSYPADFIALVKEAIATPPHPIDCLRAARIASRLEMRQEAIVLALSARDRAPQAATILRQNATALLEELGAV
jgi:hypothetical protein